MEYIDRYGHYSLLHITYIMLTPYINSLNGMRSIGNMLRSWLLYANPRNLSLSSFSANDRIRKAMLTGASALQNVFENLLKGG